MDSVEKKPDTIYWFGSVAIAALLFAALINPHWVPGGDSEVYVATARSVLKYNFRLRGFLFNGQPINMFPPGWPYLLALAMKISPKFLFLKLINLACMLASLVMVYPICRRYTPAAISGLIVVLTALLSHVYPLTFWLHSDALFLLFSTASFLVAIQIGEGKTQIWRIVLLCFLCAAAITVRWAGLLGWFVVAAAVLDGRVDAVGDRWKTKAYWLELLSRANSWLNKPKFSRYVLAAVLSLVVTAGTFGVWRGVLHLNAEEAKRMRSSGAVDETAGDSTTSGTYGFLNAADRGPLGYITRTIFWGDWYSFLFWQPFRFRVMNLLNAVSFIFGWAVLLPMLVAAWIGMKQGRWIWASLAIYGFGLAMTWPHAVSRYLVPIVFLNFAALWVGTHLIADRWPAFRKPARVLLVAFLVGFVLCNGALYGVEVWVQRSGSFYDTFEAGMEKDLIAASKYLTDAGLQKNDRIAVSLRYVNLSKNPHQSQLGLRVTAMLTHQSAIAIPRGYAWGPATRPTMDGNGNMVPTPSAADQKNWLYDPDPFNSMSFLMWARDPQVRVRYFLYQPAVSPWRAQNFRVGWLQERATHEKVVDNGAGWRLYRIPTTGPAERILPLPDVGDWPLSVPGVK